MQEIYGLIVAIENYIDPSINSVTYAENDAKEISEALYLHDLEPHNTFLLMSNEATKTAWNWGSDHGEGLTVSDLC